MNDDPNLHYRNSILNKLIKFFPRMSQNQIEKVWDKLDKSTEQQLNRYWALIQRKDLGALKQEFYE